jgi:hypothetical protein
MDSIKDMKIGEIRDKKDIIDDSLEKRKNWAAGINSDE